MKLFLSAFLIVAAGCACAQTPGVSVSMVATLEAKKGDIIPPIEAQDIRVTQNKQQVAVAGFTRLSGEMQLAILIDDSAGTALSTEIPDLRQFINSLPKTTQVAVGYMRNGLTQYTQQFTSDHAAAADTVRLPLGPAGADVSPYDSLSDAIKRWPKPLAERREVIMISSGLENLGGGPPPQNQYVNRGIGDAQKAGIVVYAIYSPAGGHLGHQFWREFTGANFLSQLTDETGGEAYNLNMGAAVSFQPFFAEIKERMANQYLLTFNAHAENAAGLQPVKVSIKEKNADVAAADRVWVPAGR